MELYREFFAIIDALNKNELDYSVVGGIALAFHDKPRFTRDIDILARPVDLSKYEEIFKSLGYFETSKPSTFGSTKFTMHRFDKRSEEDEEELIVIDLLLGHEDRHEEIIKASVTDESPAGKVRLANREDLIWMKRLSEADIENLENEDEQN